MRVQLFLMKQVARGFRSDKTRRKKWLDLEAAKALAKYPKTRQFLAQAEERRVELSAPQVKSQPVNAP